MTDIINLPASSAALAKSTQAAFTKRWGRTPEFVVVAPGRVNVIGEHVDYNGGFVLPAAINRSLVVAVRRRQDDRVRLSDATFGDATEISVDDLEPRAGDDWGRYVRGVLAGLEKAGFRTRGFDAYVGSTIPVGGGLSSSAAIEAAFALAGLALCGGSMDRFALAKLCQQAEHDYAGVPCGIMDQAAVLNAREGHLLFLDCARETFEHAPFQAPDWRLMIIDSRVSHDLASGEYAERRAACEAASAVLGVSSLREVAEEGLGAALRTAGLTPVMQRCVRHVVTENGRTHRTVAALAAGEIEEAGRQLNASHASLRDDYVVSCAELDFIAATAQKLPGVAGCRMTGGGFGGSCIALVRRDAVSAVQDQLTKAYREAFAREPGIFVTSPAERASVHWLQAADEAR